jgi:hypothetical protein
MRITTNALPRSTERRASQGRLPILPRDDPPSMGREKQIAKTVRAVSASEHAFATWPEALPSLTGPWPRLLRDLP